MFFSFFQFISLPYAHLFLGVTTTLGVIWMIGIILIAVWLLVKREAIHIYCKNGIFKIEGNSLFIDAVWNEITKIQRMRKL